MKNSDTKPVDMTPAFPGEFPNESQFRGLTRRELFAAMAMQGMIRTCDIEVACHNAVMTADMLIKYLDE